MSRSTSTVEQEPTPDRTSPGLLVRQPIRLSRSDSAPRASEEEPDDGEPDYSANCRIAARFLL